MSCVKAARHNISFFDCNQIKKHVQGLHDPEKDLKINLYEKYAYFNSLFTSSGKLCKHLGPTPGTTKCRAHVVFLKNIFEKDEFEKNISRLQIALNFTQNAKS